MRWPTLYTTLRVVWTAGLALHENIARADVNPLPSVPWQPGPSTYSVSVPGAAKPTISLYPPGGVVGVATGDSLLPALKDAGDGGRNWHFIELYDHMCPHCWYAVPIVTDLVGAFLGNPTFRMSSLNCHMHANIEVCFFLETISGAMDYPTFLLCPPLPIVDEEALRGLPHRARDLLQHLTGPQRKTFVELMRCRVRYEEPHTEAGAEDPLLSARAISQWVTDQTRLPVVHADRLYQGADFSRWTLPGPGSPPGRPGWLRDDREGAPGVPAWVPGQRWFDALRGFAALLHLGYRASRHQAAVDSARFLARAFPVKGEQLAELAQKLADRGPMKNPMSFRRFLAAWVEGSGIPGVSMTPGEEEAYMTCDGSSCVMWTLLHITLTAVAARGITGRGLHADQSVSPESRFDDPALIPEAVKFVRTFVEAFLSCHQCKMNFLRDFDNCEYGRCTITDFHSLPLWLWRAHNAVSLYVAKQDHAPVDRRWPMYEDCPACWRSELVMGVKQDARRLQGHPLNVGELDTAFHLDHVFWHMVRTYVGIEHVAFELSDLSPEEKSQVRAVLQRERAIRAGEAPPGSPAPGSAPPPGGWDYHFGSLAVLLAALATSAAGLLCYHQCSLSSVAQMFGSEPRLSRMPVIRNPQQREEEDCTGDAEPALE